MSLWGAVAYGVLPVVTGAVQEGRLGTVAGTLVLPWLAHAALFLAPRYDDDRRRRAAWRTSLWLALLVAFVPAAWLLALLVARGRAGRRPPRPWQPGPRPSASPPRSSPPWCCCCPGPWRPGSHQGAASWLFEAGLPAPRLAHRLTAWDALTGRPGSGAPGVARARRAARRTRRPGPPGHPHRRCCGPGRCWWSPSASPPCWRRGTFSTANAPTPSPSPRLPAGASRRPRRSRPPPWRAPASGVASRPVDFGWRQPIGVAVVVLAAVAPVVSTLWWVWSGSDGPLDRGPATDHPDVHDRRRGRRPRPRILVVRGSRAVGFSYVLTRTPGVRLGDDSVLPSTEAQAPLTRIVENLATAPEPADIAGLDRPGRLRLRPAAGRHRPGRQPGQRQRHLDRQRRRVPATGPGRWRPPRPAPTCLGTDPLRPWLLGLQGLAILVVAVLAAPTRKVRR